MKAYRYTGDTFVSGVPHSQWDPKLSAWYHFRFSRIFVGEIVTSYRLPGLDDVPTEIVDVEDPDKLVLLLTGDSQSHVEDKPSEDSEGSPNTTSELIKCRDLAREQEARIRELATDIGVPFLNTHGSSEIVQMIREECVRLKSENANLREELVQESDSKWDLEQKVAETASFVGIVTDSGLYEAPDYLEEIQECWTSTQKRMEELYAVKKERDALRKLFIATWED